MKKSMLTSVAPLNIGFSACFFFLSILFCTPSTVFGADSSLVHQEKIETAYYILSSPKNFSGDFWVAKVAFDYALKHKKNEVLGFQKDDYFRGMFPFCVVTIHFELDPQTDNNPGNSAKRFEVNIPHYVRGNRLVSFDVNKILAECTTKFENI